MDIAKFTIDAATAIGTVAVAVMAIWGERVRARLAPPKLELRLHTFRGTLALMTIPGVNMPGGGKPARYYHLKVVNIRPWLSVQNCRVILTAIRRRGADDTYAELEFPVPFPFVWSGEEPGPELLTVTTERVLDFGRLIEGTERFEPRLRAGPNIFDGYVRRGEAIRYELALDASNLSSSRRQEFEVAWDGEYPIVREVDSVSR